MTQYSRHPSGFCRREPFIAGAKAASYPMENGAVQPLQRMAAKGAGRGNHRRADDLYERSGGSGDGTSAAVRRRDCFPADRRGACASMRIAL